KNRELEATFTAIGDDWIRYSSTNWILWTSKPLQHVSVLLQPHLAPSDQMLIAELGDGYFGIVSPWIWEWIRSKRPDLNYINQTISPPSLLGVNPLAPTKKS